MPRFYTTDGAVYDLSRAQAQTIQNIWNDTTGDRAAQFAAEHYPDLQIAPPIRNMNPMTPEHQEIARTTWNVRAEAPRPMTAIVDEFMLEADEHRAEDIAPTREAVQNMDVAELEQRITQEFIRGDMVFQTPITRANTTANRWQQLFDDHQVEKEMEKLKPLTYPLTTEVNPDGGKRLFKTRYSELEGMYSDLHYKYNKAISTEQIRSKMYNDLNDKYQKAHVELVRIKTFCVDGELVGKRLHQICKEVGIPVPNERLNMQQKMDAFLGSVLSMIRIEGVDELAE